MPSDAGTRPDKVSVDDVGPLSSWERGLSWMRGEIDDAINNGILTPAKNLKLSSDEESDYKKGFIYERDQEILTRGHMVLTSNLDKVKSRMKVSKYLINPAKFSFDKIVRILSIVHRFVKSFRCIRDKLTRPDHKFTMMPITIVKEETRLLVNNIARKCLEQDVGARKPTDDDDKTKVKSVHRIYLETTGAKQNSSTFQGRYHVLITEDDVSRALIYLFKRASLEVAAFNKTDYLNKIGVWKNDILFCKSRILQGQELSIAEGLEDMEFLQTFKPLTHGFNLINPVLDRWSPLAFSISKFIHEKMYQHRGYESTFRYSLDYVFILEGLRLFRELVEDCVSCKKIRRKYLELMMGPVPEESLTVAPPHYISQLDIFGPVHVYVPGHEMLLRNKKVIESKIYVLVFACVTTRCVNLQVVETKSSDGVIDGIQRLSCEVGVPKYILTDQDSGIMKALSECEIRLKDLQHVLFKEKGISFRVAPVSGHNYHGQVERAIQSIQDCLQRMEVDKMRLHATGYQSLMKIIENDLNNLPIGYSYKQSGNSPTLQLIFPNLLKLGRNNNRSLDGPIKLPKSTNDLLAKINRAYEVFYDLWNKVMIPKMMKSTKWFNNKDENITIDTIVYFKKTDNELSESWTVGRVVDVVLSKDGVVRRCSIEYQNAGENIKRTTDRAARSVIKLFHIEDTDFNYQLSKIDDVIKNLDDDDSSSDQGNVSQIGAKLAMWVKTARKGCRSCCCASHCSLESHVPSSKPFMSSRVSCVQVEYDLYDGSWLTEEESVSRVVDHAYPDHVTSLTSLIKSTNLDLDLDLGED